MVTSNKIKKSYYAGKKVLKNNSGLLLLLVGIGTGVSATVLAVKAAPKAKMLLDEVRAENERKNLTKAQELLEEAKVVAPLYVAPALLGLLSIGSLIGSYRATDKKATTYATLYAASDKALKDYQAKVIESIGSSKELGLRDSIYQDKVRENPPSEENLNIPESQILCYDVYSGRYFHSTADAIRKAEAVLNKRLISEMFISLNDFYYEIGLPELPLGEDFGWDIGCESLDITFSSALYNETRPVLVVDYSIGPRFDYRKLH